MMFVQVAVAVAIGLAGLVYRAATRAPPPKICGKPGGPPVTSPRVKLRDGRYLAYKEVGVPKEKAKHKIIICHGFHDCKDMCLPYSQELLQDLGVYFLIYDRPGYGESDPNPKRCPKSEALDVEDLADNLQIGSKFYVIGLSMGAYVAWSCLYYIPHRLSGVSFVAGFVNYYWKNFPAKLADECFKTLPLQDQWTIRIAHYAPWLFYWWMTQKWFASMKTDANADMFTKKDVEIFEQFAKDPSREEKATQQGIHVSMHQDLLTAYGKNWEFDPMDVKNPFPGGEGKVHLWQGQRDRVIPIELTRHISKRLPWIKYHEVSDVGHMFFHYTDLCEGFLREILLG